LHPGPSGVSRAAADHAAPPPAMVQRRAIDATGWRARARSRIEIALLVLVGMLALVRMVGAAPADPAWLYWFRRRSAERIEEVQALGALIRL
jgi:hypothetical protein